MNLNQFEALPDVDRTIVQTINEMAHRLKMTTVAEYVENPEILKVITEIGVDYMQGYAIGEPIPLSKLIHMVE
ncbi:MAG: EAL domain-containing protein [Gammaproteobacteria bacterium]